MNHFKANGDLTLTFPLALGFERLLHDVIRITVLKSGFTENDSNQIAEKVSASLKAKIVPSEAEPLVEIVLSHQPGKVTIRTRIEDLNSAEEQQFAAR